MTNKTIRSALTETGMKHWELADALGCSENTLVRRLRHELTPDETEHILKVIQDWRRQDER